MHLLNVFDNSVVYGVSTSFFGVLHLPSDCGTYAIDFSGFEMKDLLKAEQYD